MSRHAPTPPPRLVPLALGAAALTSLSLAGCTHTVQVEVTKVAPIHMTLDVNVRVQRELEDVFDFRWQDKGQGASDAAAPPAPAPGGGS